MSEPDYAVMEPHESRLTGAFVAECPVCHKVCAHWDNDDLDEFGNLRCYHPSLES